MAKFSAWYCEPDHVDNQWYHDSGSPAHVFDAPIQTFVGRAYSGGILFDLYSHSISTSFNFWQRLSQGSKKSEISKHVHV